MSVWGLSNDKCVRVYTGFTLVSSLGGAVGGVEREARHRAGSRDWCGRDPGCTSRCVVALQIVLIINGMRGSWTSPDWLYTERSWCPLKRSVNCHTQLLMRLSRASTRDAVRLLQLPQQLMLPKCQHTRTLLVRILITSFQYMCSTWIHIYVNKINSTFESHSPI